MPIVECTLFTTGTHFCHFVHIIFDFNIFNFKFSQIPFRQNRRYCNNDFILSIHIDSVLVSLQSLRNQPKEKRVKKEETHTSDISSLRTCLPAAALSWLVKLIAPSFHRNIIQ